MSESINDKHLGLLQGVIDRMAGNSFLLKGWSVTLVSALLALAADRADRLLVAVALLPALTFRGLDGCFLAQERLFRRIYERVVAGDQTVPAYGLNPGKCGFGCWWASASSPTLMWFHGVVVLVVVLILAYLLTTPTSGGG